MWSTELDLVVEKVTSRHGKFPKVHLSVSCPEGDCFVLNPYVTPLFEVLKGYIALEAPMTWPLLSCI